MKEYAVNGDVLQKILTYLAGRPYVEVHELVKGLQSTSRELPGAETEAAPIAGSGNGASASVGGSNGSGATQAASA
jgi:hypothetical protein